MRPMTDEEIIRFFEKAIVEGQIFVYYQPQTIIPPEG